MDEYTLYGLELLKKLIRIPTVNPPGEKYEEAASLLRDELRTIGFHVEIIRIPEDWLDQYYPYAPQHHGYPRPIVYAWLGSRNKPSLHFNGHYDVVPPGSGWSRDPFDPYIEGDYIYGRGSNDMKAGIAAAVAALKAVVERDIVGDELRLEAAFVPDEEAGGAGTRYLVDVVGVKPSYVVIPEPSSIERITIGHRGYIRGLVRVYGRQVHASLPGLGENAFEKACLLVTRLIKYREKLASMKSKYPFDVEEASHPTLALGGYAESTSRKDNIVPGEFVFSFDRRVIPDEDIGEAVKDLQKAVEEAAQSVGASVDIEVKSAIPPAVIDPGSRIVRAAREAVYKVLGKEPTITVSAGRSDQVYYVRKGIEAITWGPGVFGTSHTPNEYTSITQLDIAVKAYIELARILTST